MFPIFLIYNVLFEPLPLSRQKKYDFGAKNNQWKIACSSMHLPQSKLFARANSKLCFAAQKMLFVLQNQLAPDPQSGVDCLQSRQSGGKSGEWRIEN